MFSIFSRFQGIAHASLLATKRVVLVRRVSTMRRLLARRDEPVSVPSTMASSRRALISVVPQENSTLTLMLRAANQRRVVLTSSVAMIFPSRSSGRLIGLSSGTARTQR